MSDRPIKRAPTKKAITYWRTRLVEAIGEHIEYWPYEGYDVEWPELHKAVSSVVEEMLSWATEP